MQLFLEITISLLFFLNKVLVFRGAPVGRKVGWLLGISGGVLGVAYFSSLGLYIYTVLEVSLCVIIICGIIQSKNQNIQLLARIVTVVVMLAVSYLAFRGFITVLELTSSLAVIVATHFQLREQRIGWLLMLIFHVLATVVTVNANQYIFAFFQIISIPVAVMGLLR